MKKKTNSKYDLPARHQSFTDFSTAYRGGLSRNKRSYSERMRQRKTLKHVFIVLGIVALFIVGYLIVSVMLKISQTPIETTTLFIGR